MIQEFHLWVYSKNYSKSDLEEIDYILIFIEELFTIARGGSKLNAHCQMNKGNVVCTYNELLLSHKKGRNFVICYNRDNKP